MDSPDEPGAQGNSDPWAELSEHREALKMTIEEGTPFAEYAEELLDRLDEEGY